MRILFVLENYYPNVGGVETLFKSLIDRLNELEIETVVITNRNQKHLPKKEIHGHTTILRYNFGNRYFFTVLALFPVLKYALKSDLIHTTSYNAGIPAFFASVLSRKKVIITFHEVWGKLWFELPFFNKMSKWLHYIFEQFLLRLPFTQFIAVSDFTASRLRNSGISDSRIETVYNGLEYDEWLIKDTHSESQPFTFLYFGRLGISKGLDLLLPAYRSISKSYTNTKLVLVIPAEHNRLSRWISRETEKFPNASFVEIMHNLSREELKKLIHRSRCVVVPSYSEGFGYTALESIAMGKPLISSGMGALKEIVSGKYIEMPEHSAEGLINAMERALNNDWEYVEEKRFDLQLTVENYIGIYNQILSK